MKKILSLLVIVAAVKCYAQTADMQTSDHIDRNDIVNYDVTGGDRSGTCASPNGPITGAVLTGYPADYNWLNTNGYCYTLSPVKKNITVCFTFTSPSTSITLDAGYSATGCATISFSGFTLYTCAAACAVVGTGLTYTGLTTGACYTWCFSASCTGPGPGFATICPYVINNNPLPIELTEFYGIALENQVQLSWETASEQNNDRFEIMKSSNGIDFEMIGTIQGNGTTNSTHFYTYFDNAPFDMNYYQLKQVDYDGGSTSSDMIAVSGNMTTMTVSYYNLLGEKVNIDNVQSGIYIKEMTSRNQIIRVKIYKN